MSTAAAAAMYYASIIGDVPVIMMAEPDDLTIMAGNQNEKPAKTDADV